MEMKQGQKVQRLANIYKEMVKAEKSLGEIPIEETVEVVEEEVEQVDELFGYGIGSSRKSNMEGLNPFNANIVAAHLSRHRQIHYLGKELKKHLALAIGKTYRTDPAKLNLTPEQLGAIMAVIMRTI